MIELNENVLWFLVAGYILGQVLGPVVYIGVLELKDWLQRRRYRRR